MKSEYFFAKDQTKQELGAILCNTVYRTTQVFSVYRYAVTRRIFFKIVLFFTTLFKDSFIKVLSSFF